MVTVSLILTISCTLDTSTYINKPSSQKITSEPITKSNLIQKIQSIVEVSDVEDYNTGLNIGPSHVKKVIVKIKNTQDYSIDIILRGHVILYNDGNNIPILTGIGLGGFPRECYGSMLDLANGGFPITIFPGSFQTYNFCFSDIDMSKEPKLFVSFMWDVNMNSQGMYEGIEKEFTIPILVSVNKIQPVEEIGDTNDEFEKRSNEIALCNGKYTKCDYHLNDDKNTLLVKSPCSFGAISPRKELCNDFCNSKNIVPETDYKKVPMDDDYCYYCSCIS